MDLTKIIAMEKTIAEALTKYQNMTQSISNALSRYTELTHTISEKIDTYSNHMRDVTIGIERTTRPLLAISAISKAQYVLWEYVTMDFIDRILGADDIDHELLVHEEENNFQKSEKIITLCVNHPYLISSKTIFAQSIFAYRGGYYDLAVLGLTAVIDSVLSQASGMSTPKPDRRVDEILKKLDESGSISTSEYAIISLYTTFQSMSQTFYKTAPFEEDEPANLNRHWIVHGRSQREKTQLDCIKLLHFLYGIILLEK